MLSVGLLLFASTTHRMPTISQPEIDSEPAERQSDARWHDVIAQFSSDLDVRPDLLASSIAVAPSSQPGLLIRFVRRAVEVSVSLAVLLLTAPLLLYMIVATRLDTPGPAIFRQTRLSAGGRPFKLVKLRGMYIDARERFPDLYDYRLDEADAANHLFHIKDDPRVTRVGRRFRRASLDELPNFWNVLRGDIGLVGPRPQIPEMFPYYGPYREVVLSVKPGIFSLPKVCGRDDLTLRETYLIDAYYVHHRSLALDAKVVFRGIISVLARRHVY